MKQIKSCEKGALAVVSTPLQFLNANELIERMDFTHGQIIVAARPEQVEIYSKLPRTAKDIDIRVYAVPRRPRVGAFGVVEALRRLIEAKNLIANAINKTSIQPRSLILGNLKDELHRAIANYFPAAVLYVVDDGAASLRRITQSQGLSERAAFAAGRALGVLNPEVGLQKLAEKARYFSAYDKRLNLDRGIINDYRWLSSHVDSIRQTQETWIIGQPLVETRVMSAVDYRNSILSTLASEGLERLVKYIMHPGEDYAAHHANLESSGIDVKESTLPIEALVLTSKSCPRAAITFYSSAFTTCSKIIGGAMPFVLIDARSKMKTERASELAEIYSSFLDLCVPPHKIYSV